MSLGLELGDFIGILKDREYNYWDNTYSDEVTTGRVYKVHQITRNLMKLTYRLALEDILKPGAIDYFELPESKIKILPTTKDGSPYSKVLDGD